MRRLRTTSLPAPEATEEASATLLARWSGMAGPYVIRRAELGGHLAPVCRGNRSSTTSRGGRE